MSNELRGISLPQIINTVRQTGNRTELSLTKHLSKETRIRKHENMMTVLFLFCTDKINKIIHSLNFCCLFYVILNLNPLIKDQKIKLYIV